MSRTTKKYNSVATAMTKWIGSVPSLFVHTFLFVAAFASVPLGAPLESVLLVLTTVVSLEAIYLAIFIQMAINQASQSLEEVEKDVDEIQKDIDEIEKDVDEIQEDVDEIQEDVDEIQEDVTEDDARDREHTAMLDKIEGSLGALIKEIERMKKDR
jgi:septal ring factor EnvC (AmiA/AmiB activator)